MPKNLTDKERRVKQILDRYGPEATLPVGETREEWKQRQIDEFRRNNGPDKPLPDFDKEDDMNIDKFDPKTVAEYSAIKLPVPDGLTPEIVAMVAMSAGMDSEKYNFARKMSDSSPGGDLETFNKGYHYMNIASDDPRVRAYSDILVDSRKEAQKALIAYQNGDPSLVQKHLKTFVAQAKKANLDHCDVSATSLTAPAIEVRTLVNDLINDTRFDFSDIFTEKDKIMFNSVSQKLKASDKANGIFNKYEPVEPKKAEKEAGEAGLKFKTDLPEAGSEERKKEIEEMLFNKMLANTSYYGFKGNDKVYEDAQNLPEKYKDSYAPNINKNKLFDVLYHLGCNKAEKKSELQQAVADASGEMYGRLNEALEKSYVSPVDTALSEENGLENLREKFMPLIRKSPEFLNFVNAKTPEEMKKAMAEFNQQSLDSFKDQIELDTSMSDKLTNNNEVYNKAIDECEKKISKAVCMLNAKHFTDKIIALNNAQQELKLGEFEDPFATTLREKYTKLKELNENYDYNKGPIGNDADYKMKFEEVKVLEKGFEIKKAGEKQFDEQLGLLNSTPKSIFQRNHQDSAEIIALREKTQELQKMNKDFAPGSGYNSINDDPEYQQKLLEAYKASIAYQKKVAKSNFGKEGWEPSSDMGKDRYKGALAVEALAKKVIPELIVSDMNLEEQRKDIERTGKSDYDNIYKETAAELKKSQSKAQGEPKRAEEVELARQNNVDKLARLIAIKTVNKHYETAIKKGATNEIASRSAFSQDVTQYAKEIKKREDFRRMIKDNPMDKLIAAATEKDGKALMAKLGEAHVKIGREKMFAADRKKKMPQREMKKDPNTLGKN